MGAVLRLQVLLRVPVAVEEDDGVRAREVDALAARAGAQQEQAHGRLRVEVADLLPSLVLRDAAVDPAHRPVVQEGSPVVQDVERGFELGEDEDFVAVGEEVGDEAVEHEEFAGGGDEGGVRGVGGREGPVEGVGGVADEAELHDGILELFGGDFFFCCGGCASVHSFTGERGRGGNELASWIVLATSCLSSSSSSRSSLSLLSCSALRNLSSLSWSSLSVSL